MKRKPAPHYTGPTVLGMDVSKYQANISASMKKIADENEYLKFCICRTGDGKDPDASFLPNYQAVVAAGLIPGSYHYLRADRDGATQALAMVHLLEKAKYDPSCHLPPVVDLEDGAQTNLNGGVYTGSNNTLPRQQVHEETLEMLDRLKLELGVRPMLYTGQAFHWWYSQGNPGMAAEYAEYPLWLPSYGQSALMPVDAKGDFFPWKEWTIWQYTSSGTLNGTSYKLDLNRFRGSFDDLKAFIKESDSLGKVYNVPTSVVESGSTGEYTMPAKPSVSVEDWERAYQAMAAVYQANQAYLTSPVAQATSSLITLNKNIQELAEIADSIQIELKK